MKDLNKEKNTSTGRNVTVGKAAAIMQKSKQFVRIGLQRGLLPFGNAIKIPGSDRYSYYISPKLFQEYTGYKNICTDEPDNIDKI